MTFEKDFEKMREIYLQTEKQFIELSYIIPLDNNPKTYSPRLYSILLSTCGQVESMLKMLCKRLSLKPKRNDFPRYYNILNVHSMLEFQKIFLIQKNTSILPLVKSGKIPDWWDGYNKSKHSLPRGIKHGNLKNTVYALSALYALHNIAFYALHAKSKELLNQKNWYQTDIENATDPFLRRYLMSETSRTFSSEILYCVTRYNGQGAEI